MALALYDGLKRGGHLCLLPRGKTEEACDLLS
jgi:hypothetical protein